MRVLQYLGAAGLLAMAASPVAASGPAATLDVGLVVPVRCEASIEDMTSSATEIVIRVHRSCNTSHQITVTGANGKVQITEMATGRTQSGPQATFRQAERMAQTSGAYVVRASDPAELAAFAANLRVQIAPNEI
jgi:hypothetical protein